MTIFNTERLEIKELQAIDKKDFIELTTAEDITQLIPQSKPSLEKVEAMFHEFANYELAPLEKENVVWGIYKKNQDELIGLSALLTNDNKEREIGYRFKKKYWGNGYGTEVTKQMITYCFDYLNVPKLTADVWIENTGSVKVLEKFFFPVKEFFNKQDHCMDRRYALKKEDWLK